MASPIRILGRAARLARRAHLSRPLALARDGADALLLRVGRPPLRTRAGGVELHGYLRHRSFLAHVERGYEQELDELLEAAIAPGHVVVDGGAHIGFWALRAARLVGPTGLVVAVEPDPCNASALRSNVRRAHAANVWIVERALAAGEGWANLYQAASTIGTSLVRRTDEVGPVRAIPVETTTVDALLERAGALERNILVKLDLEGGEEAALAGLRTTLAGARTITLVVEVNPKALRGAGSSPANMVTRLSELGLDVRFVDRETGGMLPVAPGADLPKGNLYCVREAATR